MAINNQIRDVTVPMSTSYTHVASGSDKSKLHTEKFVLFAQCDVWSKTSDLHRGFLTF